MPLSGTIQDFGVADILQLISQQAKTGRLSLSNGVETVLVLFKEGAVAHAENVTAPAERLLGNLLVRGDVITPSELDEGLSEQSRTLKRLGSTLVDLGTVDEAVIAQFARLQMMEVLYGLFAWNRGTYEFESMPVDEVPDGGPPIRAEHVVMNGIRMTDEWPSIREQIPSYTWKVERMRPLPPPSEVEFDAPDFLGIGAPAAVDPIGESERIVHDLIGPERTVQKIIDLSRLGEFETCRALVELLGGGYVRIVKPRPLEGAGPSRRDRLGRLARDLGRATLSAALVVLAGALVLQAITARQAPREIQMDERAIQHRLEWIQRSILTRSLEVYRLRHGHYPARLDVLIADGIVAPEDLSIPYGSPYSYRLSRDGYELWPPLR